MPRISVVIPCYNQGIFVDEAINSVLVQTWQDFEIIVVNDGSTDSFTDSHLRKLDFPKTRVLHTTNQGLASARNNGIREAQGEYILPLDADDRIGPTYLEQAIRLLDNDPELGIVYCKAQLFGDVATEWLLPEFSLQRILLDNIIFCTAFFRKSDWETAGGFDSAMIYGWEDYDFWLSLLEMGRKVVQIQDILFYYRVAADSMVRARPRQHKVESFARIFRKHQDLYAQYIEVWVDKLLDVTEPYHQAALFPEGSKAEKHPDLVRKIDPGIRRLQFTLTPEQGRSFIFRPADRQVILRIQRISLEGSDDNENPVTYSHTADFIQDDVFFFCSSVPSLQLHLPEHDRAKDSYSLIIEIEYLAFGQDCLPLLVNLLKDQMTKPDESLSPPVSPAQSVCWSFRVKWFIKAISYRLISARRFHYQKIEQSGLFDNEFYLNGDPELALLGLDPLLHYLENGAKERRKPNPLFDVAWYYHEYKLTAEQDPLLHYIEQGWKQGNKPHPLFFTSYYAEKYPESIAENQTPLAHYLKLENRISQSPMPFFDMGYYCERNPTIRKGWTFPLLHFWRFGNEEEQLPTPLFDPEFYRETYQLEELSHVELFLHYVEKGCRKKYQPSALFDAEFYSVTYPASQNSFHPLEYYQEHGLTAGHYPCREIADLPKKPVISILVPVFNTDEGLLRRCIHSVLYQAYPHWELCLVDDGSSAEHIPPLLKEYAARDKRIKISLEKENVGISLVTNKAAQLASGEYFAFLDHDDELTLDALYQVVLAINTYDPDALYSDEELIDWRGLRCTRFYKSDYNPELLLCHNYITHFFVTRSTLFRQVGGLSAECTGAQDYDLVLKIAEQSKRIHHIRRSLYRWRAAETSTSIHHDQKDYADAAGLKALSNAVERRGMEATVQRGLLNFYYRLQRKAKETCQVTALIRVSDKMETLGEWLQELLARTAYPNIDYIILHRNSVGDISAELPEELRTLVRFYQLKEQEGEAAALNRLAEQVMGEHLVFLQPGILPQEKNWVKTMLAYSQEEGCGVVSGVVAGPDEEINNLALPDLSDKSCQAFRSLLTEGSVHLNGMHCPQNVLACSFDFCMIEIKLFRTMQGFDGESFPEYLYDIDFCLRLREAGREHIFTPFCKAVITASKERFSSTEDWIDEKICFQKRWRAVLEHNPYYNENRLLTELQVSREEWLHWIAGG
ncbi:MAG: glycosyltransferase [Candidatus Electrothrix aestuarii]|uniref:Glycosyltransferase n=1 Tax=Candidatus Electrothrix aestuarii TaxID=3062594 RepID=A0AAU8LZN8_9BACT|nr:glycosyltransferase [Candidatus Electrothrix aestuarii]